MTGHLLRSALLVLALAGMIAVNGLANSLPLNGQTTGEVSDAFDVRFVPAGYVFSIWGVIYLALIAFVGNLLRPSQGAQPWANRIASLFVLSCAVNAAWLFAWHYEHFVTSVILMVLLLGLLIAMYLTLDIGRTPARGARRWLVGAPIQLYLGWITVATVANVTSTLQHAGWGGWGLSAEVWATILLVVCVAIGAAMTVTRRDAVYLGVLAWATAGIAVAQADSPLVSTTAWIACGLTAALLVVSVVWRRAPGASIAGPSGVT